LVPLPSQPATAIELKGGLSGKSEAQALTNCIVDSTQARVTAILPPVTVSGGFAVTFMVLTAAAGVQAIGAAPSPGAAPVEISLQVVTNPAGGGGGPTWTGSGGTVTVDSAGPFGNLKVHPIVLGSIAATLHKSDVPDVFLSGTWGCVI
jgi:hypothetical protein